MNPIIYRLAAKPKSSIVNRKSSIKIALLCTLTALPFSIGIAGIGAQQGSSKRGFSGAQAKEQMAWEEKMRAIPDARLLRKYMDVLAAEPHHLGSPRDKENAEWILNKFRSWGLSASIEEYRVLFPMPKERRLELLSPGKYLARLKEPAMVEDPDSSDANQLPTYNAYSVDGDVTAQVVYVNYGVPEDYETLRKMGVDVKGKIVLARYGASWRGIKPKVAHENGAIGCLIYSDPKAKEQSEKKDIEERTDLRIGALGSGSDYTAFIDHLGVASLNLSFGGEGGGGVYHSIYDSIAWYTRFSDTTFVYGRALAQLDGTAVMRLASAPVLPFEFTNLADTIGRYVDELEKLASKEAGTDIGPLKTAQQVVRKSAEAFEHAYARAAASGGIFDREAAHLRALNRLLYQSERLLTAPGGLPGRAWFKHQLYAPGFYTGYGVKTIPYVREALEQKRPEEAKAGVQVVRDCLVALAAHIDSAAQLLR